MKGSRKQWIKSAAYLFPVSRLDSASIGLKGKTSPINRQRKKGATYDEWWRDTLASDPDFIAVLSFNEWHEGTQIEPAIRIQKIQPPYLSYEKAYSKTGIAAQFSYLRRTAHWIHLFLSMP